MITRLSAPLFAQLELTEGCNHKCVYCSNPFSDDRLVKPTIAEVDLALEEVITNKLFSVVLTGGEPFTNRAVLHHSARKLIDKRIEVYVNTNLSQPMDLEDIRMLKNVDYVLVSFPSHDEQRFNAIVRSGSFKTVVGNLEKLARDGVKFGVNQVITPYNLGDVEETVDFLRKRFDLKEYSASPVIPNCSSMQEAQCIEPRQVKDLANKLLKIEADTGIKTDMLTFIPYCFFPESMPRHRISSHGCSAGRDSVIIGASGEVRRCALLAESYGNIRSEKLKDIWKKIQTTEKPTNPHCDSCMPNEYCAGGCEARARVCQGKDPFVIGLLESRKANLYMTLDDSMALLLERVNYRDEEGGVLIGNGGSYIIGNDQMLKFAKSIEGKKFTFGEVKEHTGQEGINLVTYLVNRGLIRICNSV